LSRQCLTKASWASNMVKDCAYNFVVVCDTSAAPGSLLHVDCGVTMECMQHVDAHAHWACATDVTGCRVAYQLLRHVLAIQAQAAAPFSQTRPLQQG
jgi:hypothetical protein